MLRVVPPERVCPSCQREETNYSLPDAREVKVEAYFFSTAHTIAMTGQLWMCFLKTNIFSVTSLHKTLNLQRRSHVSALSAGLAKIFYSRGPRVYFFKDCWER